MEGNNQETEAREGKVRRKQCEKMQKKSKTEKNTHEGKENQKRVITKQQDDRRA